MSLVGDLQTGSEWWCPDADHGWVRARVTAIDNDTVEVAIVEPAAVPTSAQRQVLTSSLVSIGNDASVDLALVDDLSRLDRVTVASLLATLRARYHRDLVYTVAGPTLISVNPFKSVPGCYGLDRMRHAIEHRDDTTPHIFTITRRCHERVRQTGVAQSLIICGDSGSGKTETAKYALQMLTEISASCHITRTFSSQIQTCILQCNPILEAFGNAQTSRNDNSSRFGKYLEISIDRNSGQMVHASMAYFMLETSRVVSHSIGERTFHALYTLVQWRQESALRSELGLVPRAAAYSMLVPTGLSGPLPAPKVATPGEEWPAITAAMATVGMGEGEILAVTRVLAAILHLSNLEFVSDALGNAQIVPGSHLTWFLKLTTLDEDKTNSALISRQIGQDRHRVCSPVSVDKSISSKNALAKELYARLFHWLVARMNLALHPAPATNVVESDEGGAIPAELIKIGVLDVFGFERFDDKNGFEQFCINYCNERLQALFVGTVLAKSEQDLYVSEGIGWHHIAYHDCQNTLAALDVGFRLLDDECLVPQGSPTNFFVKLIQAQKASSILTDDSRARPLHITVAHYAGAVQYDVSEFLVKNRDRLSDDLHDLLETAADPIMKTIINSNTAASTELTEDQFSPTTPTTAGRKSLKKGKFQGSHFRGQVGHLITALSSTDPHFIRCVKPNATARSNLFHGPTVIDQLANAGVLELVRVRQAGYPIRIAHDAFRARYRHQMDDPHIGPFLSGRFPDAGQYAIGTSLVFLKAEAHGALESALGALVKRAVIPLQAAMALLLGQGWRIRRQASVTIQATLVTWTVRRRCVALAVLAAAFAGVVGRTRYSLMALETPAPAEVVPAAPAVTVSVVDGVETTVISPQIMVMVVMEPHQPRAIDHIAETVRSHRGRFRIYNFCLDVQYDLEMATGAGTNSVVHFPFSGHAPCPFQMMIDFCRSMEHWLAQPHHLALIHSKAGKGRCSMMVAAYLLHSAAAASVNQALEMFWAMKDPSETIQSLAPSQRRYVGYFVGQADSVNADSRFISMVDRPIVLGRAVNLTSVVLDGIDPVCIADDQEVWLMIALQQDDGKIRQKWIRMLSRSESSCVWRIRKSCPLVGDVKIEVLSRERKGKMARVLMYLCLNAAFLPEQQTFAKSVHLSQLTRSPLFVVFESICFV